MRNWRSKYRDLGLSFTDPYAPISARAVFHRADFRPAPCDCFRCWCEWRGWRSPSFQPGTRFAQADGFSYLGWHGFPGSAVPFAGPVISHKPPEWHLPARPGQAKVSNYGKGICLGRPPARWRSSARVRNSGTRILQQRSRLANQFAKRGIGRDDALMLLCPNQKSRQLAEEKGVGTAQRGIAISFPLHCG